MNILIAVKNYWPSSGGVQSVTKYMAEGLVKKGHQVSVLTRMEPNTPIEEEYNDVKIFRVKQTSIFKFNFGDKALFQKFILGHSWDTVISVCAQSYSAEWMFPILDKIKARKILYMHGMRGSSIDLPRIDSFRTFMKEAILVNWWNLYFKRNWKYIKKYDAAIHLFSNDSSFSYFKAKGYLHNYAIANSCDSVFFEENEDCGILDKYGISKPYFIQVANYDGCKNHLLSVKSFLQADSGDAELVLIGSSGNKFYRKIVDYLNAFGGEKKNKIHVLTAVPRVETVSLIKESYATILSSLHEYFPISIVEGLAAGKPFISTHVGEVPKFLGGHVGSTIGELAYWIEYYLSHPEYVVTLGREAKEFALKNMRLQDKINQLEEICKG